MKRPVVEGDRKSTGRRKTELEATFARFLAMSYADQLDFCARLQEYLPLSKAVGPPLDDHYEKRLATLDCLRQVRAHLGINSGPTFSQYAEASRELGLPWSAQQIQRLWGRWLEAVNAFESGRPPRSAAARNYGSAQVGSKRHREEYVHAVRLWLETKPARTRGADYDDWAREHNAGLDQAALDQAEPMPRRTTIIAALALSWHEVLAIARGEKTHGAAHVERREKGDWSNGPHRLISVATIALMRGSSMSSAMYESRKFRFPLPVATFRGRRAWLFEEVEAYLQGETVERGVENRLRHLYLDVHEYAELVGLRLSSASRVAGDVKFAGMVGSTRYWSRREVEEWVARNRQKVEARKGRRARTGTAHPERTSDFITSGGLRTRLGISTYAVNKLTLEPGFPSPVVTVGNDCVWLLRQVEAYLTGHPLPAAPDSALEAKLVDIVGLGDVLALRGGIPHPSRTQLPPPLFHVGGRQRMWHVDEVKEWIAALPVNHRARINRRREKRGLPPL